MTAATYDIALEQGATFRLQLTYGRRTGQVGSGDVPILEPYDLTGCIARMQVRKNRDTPLLVEATTENGGIVFESPLTSGHITVQFTAAQTDSITLKRARFDLELEFPSGDVVRILQGKVTISPNITRPGLGS